MSYILEAIKQSDRKRRQQSLSDLDSVHIEPELEQPRIPVWVIVLSFVLLANFVFAGLWLYKALEDRPVAQAMPKQNVAPHPSSNPPHEVLAQAPGSVASQYPAVTENPPQSAPSVQSAQPKQSPDMPVGGQTQAERVAAYLQRLQTLKARLVETGQGDEAQARIAQKLFQAEQALLALQLEQEVSGVVGADNPQPTQQPPLSMGETLIKPGNGRQAIPGWADAPVLPTGVGANTLIEPSQGVARKVPEPSTQSLNVIAPSLIGGETMIVPSQNVQQRVPAADSSDAYRNRQLPLLSDLPEEVRMALPPLVFNAHMYASDPRFRSVMINGKELSENDQIDFRTSVVAIEEESVVLQFDELRFRVAILDQWSEQN